MKKILVSFRRKKLTFFTIFCDFLGCLDYSLHFFDIRKVIGVEFEHFLSFISGIFLCKNDVS